MKLTPLVPFAESMATQAAEDLRRVLEEAQAALRAHEALEVRTADGFCVRTINPLSSGLLRLVGLMPDGAEATRLIHYSQLDLQFIVRQAPEQDGRPRREIGYHTGFQAA